MEEVLNVENDWDGTVDCPEVMGPSFLISEEEVAAAMKGLKMGKTVFLMIGVSWCIQGER